MVRLKTTKNKAIYKPSQVLLIGSLCNKYIRKLPLYYFILIKLVTKRESHFGKINKNVCFLNKIAV